MKLKGSITVSRASSSREPDFINIRVVDEVAACSFLEVKLGITEFGDLLSGRGFVPWHDSGPNGETKLMNSDSETQKSIAPGPSQTQAVISGTCSTPFIETLHKAGIVYDGHVTNGSLQAQTQVVSELLREFKSELKVAGDFGLFKDHLRDEDRPYPEYVCIEVLKKFAESRGLKI